MSRGGKQQSTEVPAYHLSFHVGLCASGTDTTLLSAYAGDKKFYEGTGNTLSPVSVNKPDLFGGLKKEGGLSGSMMVMPGLPGQVVPERLATRLDLTPTTCPGYRGVFSLWFTGADSYSGSTLIMGSPRGFMVGSGNPYLKPMTFRLRRPSVGLNATYQYINLTIRREKDDPVFNSTVESEKGYVMKASNPAHVLYEIYTNTSWGDGRDPATIDKASFEAAAITLFNEKFGIAFKWTRQSAIRTIVSEIVDHIQASLFDDPETGLLTIKLLRADYVTASLPSINPSNAKLSHYKRKLWGEVSSEVVVTWTNPENETDMTVTAHNLSVSQAQGNSPVSTSRNFYMVRDPVLAGRLAERELAALSYPLAACDATVHRTFNKVVPGDVLKLTWPEHRIDQMAMRVMEVLPGDSSSGKITLKLQEDIFALPIADYIGTVTTQWKPNTEKANNVPAKLGTLPAYMTAKIFNKPTVKDLKYPVASVGILLTRPNKNYIDFDVFGPKETVAGYTPYASLSKNPFTSRGVTDVAMPISISSVVGLNGLQGTVNVGDFAFVSNLTETGEICVVTSVNKDEGLYTLKRGCLDTIPRTWAVGTEIFFCPGNFTRLTDGQERSDGEDITLKFLPSTSMGQLDLDDATGRSVSLTDRTYLPLRPANMKINGVAYGTVVSAPTGDLAVTWSNRNRITESQVVMAWDAANVAPETEQTTDIMVYSSADELIWVHRAATGTSYTIPRSALSGRGTVKVAIQAVRIGGTINNSDIPTETYRSFTAPQMTIQGL